MRKTPKYSPNLNKFVISAAVAMVPSIAFSNTISECVVFHKTYDNFYRLWDEDSGVKSGWETACGNVVSSDAWDVCIGLTNKENFLNDIEECYYNEIADSNHCLRDYATGDITSCDSYLCDSGEYVSYLSCVTCPQYYVNGTYIKAESETNPEAGSGANGLAACYIPTGLNRTFSNSKGKFYFTDNAESKCTYYGS